MRKGNPGPVDVFGTSFTLDGEEKLELPRPANKGSVAVKPPVSAVSTRYTVPSPAPAPLRLSSSWGDNTSILEAYKQNVIYLKALRQKEQQEEDQRKKEQAKEQIKAEGKLTTTESNTNIGVVTGDAKECKKR